MQPETPRDDEATVTFHRAYPAAIPPMRADKAALGVMPTMAYRHCEPLRTASAFGWYIFPPEDIFFKWNGADVLLRQDGDWVRLTDAQLPGFGGYWDARAPEELQGLAPPFISQLPVPGFVQIWSGLLCATRADWSVLVRPLANVRSSNLYACFEGVVESDRFRPFPLFINIQLIATDVVIHIPKTAPLFQVQPLMRGTYGEEAHRYDEREGLEMSPADWAGYRKTIRVGQPDEPPQAGEYTAATRKRTKHEA